jgi:hypothetical protein
MHWRACLTAFLALLTAAAPSLAEDAPRYGIGVGAFASRFVLGDAGPVTLVSETPYADTFSTGSGLRLEAYRNFAGGWRAQAGLVYTGWDGQYFAGGEFPAGVQFGDFSLWGLYLGGRFTFGGDAAYRPYLLGNLGFVSLSEMSVVSGGTTMPYYTGNWVNYMELGGGVARRVGDGALALDLRLQYFGIPEVATWLASSTGGWALLFGVGYEWELGR